MASMENVHEKFYKRWLRNWTAPSSVVRRRHPTATAHSWADRWTIYANTVPQAVLGEGKTALLAWKDAERKMMSNAKSQATDAALSRQVACTDGLCGNGSEVGAGDTAKG